MRGVNPRSPAAEQAESVPFPGRQNDFAGRRSGRERMYREDARKGERKGAKKEKDAMRPLQFFAPSR
jgi:hypothetical protein